MGSSPIAATYPTQPTRLSFVDDSSTFNVSAAIFDETVHANQLLIFICAGDHAKSPLNHYIILSHTSTTSYLLAPGRYRFPALGRFRILAHALTLS